MEYVAWFAAIVAAVAPGLAGPVTALACRRALLPRDGVPPADRRAAATSATAVTVAAVLGVLSLAGEGGALMLYGAALGSSDSPNGISDRSFLVIGLQAAVPALVVVIALVLARTRRRDRITFTLALLSPVLPICLWLAGVWLHSVISPLIERAVGPSA